MLKAVNVKADVDTKKIPKAVWNALGEAAVRAMRREMAEKAAAEARKEMNGGTEA